MDVGLTRPEIATVSWKPAGSVAASLTVGLAVPSPVTATAAATVAATASCASRDGRNNDRELRTRSPPGITNWLFRVLLPTGARRERYGSLQRRPDLLQFCGPGAWKALG